MGLWLIAGVKAARLDDGRNVGWGRGEKGMGRSERSRLLALGLD